MSNSSYPHSPPLVQGAREPTYMHYPGTGSFISTSNAHDKRIVLGTTSAPSATQFSSPRAALCQQDRSTAAQIPDFKYEPRRSRSSLSKVLLNSTKAPHKNSFLNDDKTSVSKKVVVGFTSAASLQSTAGSTLSCVDDTQNAGYGTYCVLNELNAQSFGPKS